MTTSDTVLDEHSLSARPDGIAVELSLPWYRSVWLSSVSSVSVSLDGAPVPAEKLIIEFGGRTYRVAELGEQWDTLWFIQDRLVAVVPLSEPPSAGEQVDVEATIELRLPYMQIAPQRYVTNRATTHKVLTVEGKAAA
jgi:hypothetical protein